MKISLALILAAVLVLGSTAAWADWEVQHSVPSDDMFMGIDAIDEDNAVAVGMSDMGGAFGGAVFSTSDAGETWTFQGPETFHFFFSDAYFSAPGEGWVIGMKLMTGVLLRVWDNFEQWESVPVPIEVGAFMDIKFPTDQIGYVCGDTGYLIKTYNGGAAWQRQDIGTESTSTLNGCFFLDENTGWIAGGSVGDPVEGRAMNPMEERRAQLSGARAYGGLIIRTTDGVNWDVVLEDQPYHLFDVHFLDTMKGFAVGERSSGEPAIMLRSDDAGATWDEVSIPGHPKGEYGLYAVQFIDENTGFAVGGGANPFLGGWTAILVTFDGGDRWFTEDFSPNHLPFDADFIPGSGTGWVTATELSIYRYTHSDDLDSDEVPNDMDNCPVAYNPDQEDGDGDDIGDVCDNCPNESNPTQSDHDGDSIGNICDNCPFAVNPGQEDTDGNGVGDHCQDDDGDGYPQSEDCDDTDWSVNPGEEEVPDNGIDDDCDGRIDEKCFLGILF